MSQSMLPCTGNVCAKERLIAERLSSFIWRWWMRTCDFLRSKQLLNSVPCIPIKDSFLDKLDLLCVPAHSPTLFTYRQARAGNLPMHLYVKQLKDAVNKARNSIAHFHWHLPSYRGHRALHDDLDAFQHLLQVEMHHSH